MNIVVSNAELCELFLRSDLEHLNAVKAEKVYDEGIITTAVINDAREFANVLSNKINYQELVNFFFAKNKGIKYTQ